MQPALFLPSAPCIMRFTDALLPHFLPSSGRLFLRVCSHYAVPDLSPSFFSVYPNARSSCRARLASRVRGISLDLFCSSLLRADRCVSRRCETDSPRRWRRSYRLHVFLCLGILGDVAAGANARCASSDMEPGLRGSGQRRVSRGRGHVSQRVRSSVGQPLRAHRSSLHDREHSVRISELARCGLDALCQLGILGRVIFEYFYCCFRIRMGFGDASRVLALPAHSTCCACIDWSLALANGTTGSLFGPAFLMHRS